jgi:hypothetical protein
MEDMGDILFSFHKNQHDLHLLVHNSHNENLPDKEEVQIVFLTYNDPGLPKEDKRRDREYN